jgi:hypothetical protein
MQSTSAAKTLIHKITNVPVFNMAFGLTDFDAANPLLFLGPTPSSCPRNGFSPSNYDVPRHINSRYINSYTNVIVILSAVSVAGCFLRVY